MPNKGTVFDIIPKIISILKIRPLIVYKSKISPFVPKYKQIYKPKYSLD